tara:strand:+ start:109 stop:405 length:297 start_codon:yes stop_codon:yes gene_type:complete
MSTREYNQRQDQTRANLLTEAIMLSVNNHEPTYNAVRTIWQSYRGEGARLDSSLKQDIKEAIDQNIPNEYLPSCYTTQSWENLNWTNIVMEIIGGFEE